jgi:5-methylcytosine-specific restriction endonuclease McrA
MECAESFYKSRTWAKCRTAYAKSVGGLCERCKARGMYNPGRIVHHKVYIGPENINDPSVTLNWDNLELLCRSCHELEHKSQRRYAVVNGRVVGVDNAPLCG